MTSNDLKTRIRAHLATANEATAKQIAKAVDHSNYPSVVISALSEMRTDAEVECEKKAGKGNELWYWLTNVGSLTANAAYALEKNGTAMMEEIDIPVVRKDRTTESATAKSVIIEGLNAQIDSLEAKLELAEKQRDSHFEEAEDLRSQLDQAENANAAWLALAAEFGCHSIPELRYWIGKLTTADAEEQAQPQQAGDLPLPAGYLVASPNKPLRKFSKERNAMTAAAAAARQSGLAEIYAIHPHMKAVRGVEFKEAA